MFVNFHGVSVTSKKKKKKNSHKDKNFGHENFPKYSLQVVPGKQLHVKALNLLKEYIEHVSDTISCNGRD